MKKGSENRHGRSNSITPTWRYARLAGLGVMTGALFSAAVIMVIVTTLITPLALKWSLFRGRRKAEAA